MIDGLSQLDTHCDHLDPFGKQPEYILDEDFRSYEPLCSLPMGNLALVSIGNPLREEDSAAIVLTQTILSKSSEKDFCLFNLDCGFAWLKQILLRHENVIVLDSIEDNDDAKDGFVDIKLTREVMYHSGFVIRTSHGLSWLDELKLLDFDRPGSLQFFGINGNLFLEASYENRSDFLMRAATRLHELIDDCRLNSADSNLNYRRRCNA